MKRPPVKKILLFGAMSCILLPGPAAWAAKTGQEDLARQIGSKKQQVAALDARHEMILADLEKTRRQLEETKKRASGLKKRLERIEEEISLAKDSLEQVTQKAAQTEKYASRRLAAYYKLLQTGVAPVILGSGSLFEASVRQTALQRVIAQDNRTWEDLNSGKKRLRELTASLEERLSAQKALQGQLLKELALQAQEEDAKKLLLARIGKEKDLAVAALASLEKAARELDKAIREIKPAPPRTEKEQEAPRASFPSLQGKLPLPVAGGSIQAPFGAHKDPRFKAVTFRSGVDIAAEYGEPFHAVHGGAVVFSGWFKGYGNMIIIDHGDSYFSVCAHAEDLFKEKGQAVEAGEVIGTVGDSGSFSGPGLYFELRHHSTPLDPAQWLRKEN